jgi:hypothetical protein
MYTANLSLHQYSYRTAESYLAALSFQCKLRCVDDTTKHFVVSKALEGLKRTAKPKRLRLPITLNILHGILTKLSVVCQNLYEIKLFSAAYTLAFFGFFRVGEITAAGKSDVGVNKIVGINDIAFVDDGKAVLIHVRFSKADQLGKGATIKLQSTGHLSMCPVLAVKGYLANRPAVSGPLLCHLNCTPLTRYQFSAILKKVLSVLDPQLKDYTSHSFRLGAASSAANRGWSVEKIKESGRWSSDSYKLYVRKL